MLTIKQFISSEIVALRDLYYKQQLSDCSQRKGITLLNTFRDSFYIHLEVLTGEETHDPVALQKGVEVFEKTFALLLDTMH